VTPYHYCQQKAAHSGSSFYYGFLFLPPERRRAITALYAFCREVDDVVDECTDVGVARTKLAWWRVQVAAIYGGATARDSAPASSEQGPAERGAGTCLRDATAESAVSASVIPAPCASPGSDPKGNPLPPCDAPRLRDATVEPAPVPPSEGAPQHPVAQALVPVVQRFRLPQARLQEIINGMEMDLTQRRYPDFAALKLYCHRVAGVVGLLSAEIFGYSDPGTLKYAENLGMAFQLTNIIRDIGEDARRDRVYLPLDELARYNVTVADILHSRESDGFRRLMEFQIERALGYYRDAFALLPAADRKSQRPGLVMAAIYQTLLAEIRADGSQVLTQRISLTPIRKLWIAWKTWIKG
jgi:phytoene synthase